MTIKDIEKVITNLPPKQLTAFRAWFYKFENSAWDKQFEQDVKKGRLDKIAEGAIEDYKKGHCREL
ncbi:MAG: hypothetical protein HYZ83_07745 [Candidatus Omnitrophica bacterium]|nr:hypothetical protein [Candidatus Omnitrophota bacterium]